MDVKTKLEQCPKLYLTHNTIKVQDIDSMLQFYQQKFGMKIIAKRVSEKNKETTHFLGFKETGSLYSMNETFLELRSPITAQNRGGGLQRKNCEGKYSVYWKIGLNLFDLHHAYQRLSSAEVKVTEPLTIPDVGVLCHVFDPEGYDIELMQYTLPGSSLLPHGKTEESSLGQAAILSVITIRVRDIGESLKFYCDILGMKLLCKQDQSRDYGFDVYYLGFTGEVPPNPGDPNHVSNREWTYQRPYTLLELEVYTEGQQPQPFEEMTPPDYGFKGISLGCEDLDQLKIYFQNKGYNILETWEKCHSYNTKAFIVRDPDNIPLTFLHIM